MNKTRIVILLLIITGMSFGHEVNETLLLKSMHTISSHELLDFVKIQCDDKYQGRLTGTSEYMECAEWVAAKFSEWGLTPFGNNGSWFQSYKIPYTLVFPECGLALHIPVKDNGTVLKQYNYITEYMPGSTSGNGEVTGEVIYAGYGITAPELGYDDYAGIDVKDKIILIERECPVSPEAGADKFNPWYEYSFHQIKLENAVKHGAVGMLYNYGPIANPNNSYAENFVYVHIGDSVIKDIFSSTGFQHDIILKKINSSLKSNSFNTKKIVTIKMSTKHFPDGNGANVLGYIKGSDPALSKEVIIIGAHLDGLGKCYDIMPGANDNASAVAVLMGLAKAVSQSKIPIKRSLLFIAFGSEEQGIMGSKTYLEKPVIPLEKSVLINLDGVGTGQSIGANAGKNYPLLWSYIENANNKYIHRQLTTNFFSNLGRPRLDAARFLRAGVPSLSFYTYGSENFYHLPLDNPDIINPEIMEDITRILFIATIQMANSMSPLK
jgi:hypothetical protein